MSLRLIDGGGLGNGNGDVDDDHAATRALGMSAVELRSHTEVPERFAQAAVSHVDGPMRAAIDDMLSHLPDVIGMVSDRARAFDESGKPLGMAAATIQEVRRLVAGMPAVAFVGDRGVGKTYALCAMARAAATRLVPTRVVSVATWLDDVRATFAVDRDAQSRALLERYRGAPILVLDDLDKMNATDWSTSFLFSVVNWRSERRLPTCVSSNASPDAIEAACRDDVVSARMVTILDRLQENTRWVTVTGRSRRTPRRVL